VSHRGAGPAESFFLQVSRKVRNSEALREALSGVEGRSRRVAPPPRHGSANSVPFYGDERRLLSLESQPLREFQPNLNKKTLDVKGSMLKILIFNPHITYIYMQSNASTEKMVKNFRKNKNSDI